MNVPIQIILLISPIYIQYWYEISNKLQLTSDIWYSDSETENNSKTYSSLILDSIYWNNLTNIYRNDVTNIDILNDK